MRGYDYLSFVGQDAFHLNAELRFPLIDAMATPIGILGGIRGTLFANFGGADLDERPASRSTRATRRSRRRSSATSRVRPDDARAGLRRPPTRDHGFRLVDARASYGISLQTFALGFPVHFDWSWRTLFNRTGRTSCSRRQGGSAAFRKPKFTMWIGYDF